MSLGIVNRAISGSKNSMDFIVFRSEKPKEINSDHSSQRLKKAPEIIQLVDIFTLNIALHVYEPTVSKQMENINNINVQSLDHKLQPSHRVYA